MHTFLFYGGNMKTKFKFLSTMALFGTLVGITACGQNPTSPDSPAK